VTRDLDGDGTDDICRCEPIQQECDDQTSFPVCDAPCPDPTDICVSRDVDGDGTLDTCLCVPDLPPTCEDQSTLPVCDAPCPPGPVPLVCIHDTLTDECQCVPEEEECEDQGTFPVCDAPCPLATDIWCPNPGEECLPQFFGNTCRCVQSPCDAADFPTCDGTCPDGQACIEDPTMLDCRCEPLEQCDNTHFPTCDGFCPDDEECVHIAGTDLCRCDEKPIKCESADFPQCDGFCPPTPVGGQATCVPGLGGGPCLCLGCIETVPSGNILIKWNSKIDLVWTQEVCAKWYNVYKLTAVRLVDLDLDGLADDYGACDQPMVPIPATVMPGAPASGLAEFVLVTAENFFGEGTMGYNSSLPSKERPNLTPCP